MKARSVRTVLLWLLLILTGSCGIETVPSLPAPPVSDFNLQSDPSKLSFTHISSVYADLDYFYGYFVYYKISPLTTGQFDTLIQDRDALATSPTVSQLVALGYSRIDELEPPTFATATPSNAVRIPLVFIPSFDGEKLQLDFLPVLQPNPTPTTYLEPTFTRGASGPTGNLFRSPNVAVNAPDQLFSSFTNSSYGSSFSSSIPTDVRGLATDPIHPNDYQIEFFLVATGTTGNLAPVYSTPVPWGVIGSSTQPLGPTS